MLVCRLIPNRCPFLQVLLFRCLAVRETANRSASSSRTTEFWKRRFVTAEGRMRIEFLQSTDYSEEITERTEI